MGVIMVRSCFALLAVAVLSGVFAPSLRAEDPKVNYIENVLPIFKAKCGTCHGADQAKGGFVIDTYGQLMQGGASGPVVEPGDADGSRLWALVSHSEQPVMPPREPKLPDDQLAVINKWISLGALETATSTAVIKKKASFTLSATEISTGQPSGPPPMPEGLLAEPKSFSTRGNAVTALATNPWSPLAAVAGFQQVLLYDLSDRSLVGVLPFPEGTPHVLRFSRNGTLLLAAGGRGGQSGRVVVFEVRTGNRVFEIGSEPDAILAADISADHSLIALGGPKKVVRVYSTADGELQYEIKKHTDWITALEFSPDGVLLATGDRSNGMIVTEAATGREFYVLVGHTGTITGISWRIDSNAVASVSEDSTIRLWEMTNGTQFKGWGAHGGGASGVTYLRDGRIATIGRDNVARIWDENGGQQRQFPGLPDVGMRVQYSESLGQLLAGDWTGQVHIYTAADGTELAQLLTNPSPIASRLQVAEAAVAAVTAEHKAAADQVAADAAAWNALKEAANVAAAAEVTAQRAFEVAEAELNAAAALAVDRNGRATSANDAVAAAMAAVDAAQAEVVAADVTTDDARKSNAAKGRAAATVALEAAQRVRDAAAVELQAAQAVQVAKQTLVDSSKAVAEIARQTSAAAAAAAVPNADQQAALAARVAAVQAEAARLDLATKLADKLRNQQAAVAAAAGQQQAAATTPAATAPPQ